MSSESFSPFAKASEMESDDESKDGERDSISSSIDSISDFSWAKFFSITEKLYERIKGVNGFGRCA